MPKSARIDKAQRRGKLRTLDRSTNDGWGRVARAVHRVGLTVTVHRDLGHVTPQLYTLYATLRSRADVPADVLRKRKCQSGQISERGRPAPVGSGHPPSLCAARAQRSGWRCPRRSRQPSESASLQNASSARRAVAVRLRCPGSGRRPSRPVPCARPKPCRLPCQGGGSLVAARRLASSESLTPAETGAPGRRSCRVDPGGPPPLGRPSSESPAPAALERGAGTRRVRPHPSRRSPRSARTARRRPRPRPRGASSESPRPPAPRRRRGRSSPRVGSSGSGPARAGGGLRRRK